MIIKYRYKNLSYFKGNHQKHLIKKIETLRYNKNKANAKYTSKSH